MEDKRIIELYWLRSEDSISQTASKYGAYCRSIAWNILYNQEDTEECVNDTWLRTWDTIPPQRPKVYSGFEDGTEDYEISLILTDLITQDRSKTKTVAEGVWSFQFTLDRSAVPESIHLPDTVVPGIDLNTGDTVEVILTDIVLTNTGIRFKYLSNNGSIDLHLGHHRISPLLTNGKRIEDGTGSGVPIAGTNQLSYSWHWPIPVDLEDIVSEWIGDTEIEIP